MSNCYKTPDGWYFTDSEGQEDFGPYPTLAQAEHAWGVYQRYFTNCPNCRGE